MLTNDSQAGFVLKVFILSTVISVLIKYGGPTLNITPTPNVVLAIVLLPAAIIALALWGRTWQSDRQ